MEGEVGKRSGELGRDVVRCLPSEVTFGSPML